MISVRGYEVKPDFYYDPKYLLWVKVTNSIARIGIDPLEQETRGAFVVVHLKEVGKIVQRGESFGSVEAEKHVGQLLSPVSGKIVAVNHNVIANPRLANTDPYGEGWFVEIAPSNFDTDKEQMITGEETLRKWYEEKIKKYEEWGWLAE